jgi:hypothetical protein
MAIEFSVGAEEIHKIGELGVKRIRRWLDCTYRFRIDQTIYDLDPHGHPYPKLRLPQLPETPGVGTSKSPRFERFDLVGALLDENGCPGNRLYVECKESRTSGNQGRLYDEYLAVCYSGFLHLSQQIGAPADVEFMWATTHPFAVSRFSSLTTADHILHACAANPGRLGTCEPDRSIAEQLAPRLWIAIVNSRVDEMIMGLELQKAVVSRLVELAENRL